MKHKYEGLLIDHEQPDSDENNFFNRLAIGERFRFLFIETIRHGAFLDDDVDDNNPLLARILLVMTLDNDLVIEIDTSGEFAPPGIKHGCYKLKFASDSLFCDNLPDEMFEE
ncbi:MAG: hypothetical protein AAB766_04955 [Patescibacteria group bacterium]|mgnify:CR=1 FL=1